MKRVISFVLVLCMLVSMCVHAPSTVAFAAGDQNTQNDEQRPAPDYNYEDAEPPSGVQTGDKEEQSLAVWEQFTDVKGHWAENTLKWAVFNGLMCGRTSQMMDPNGTITRAEMVTMITRAFGAYKLGDVSMYIDLKPDMWCYEYFQRIVQMGCFNGYGNSVNPNEAVSRQEVAVLLVRAGGYLMTGSSYLYKFSDYRTCDYKAAEYLATAISNGLITGYPDGTCRPRANISRAEFAVMMQRMASAHMNGSTVFGEKNVDGSLMVGAETKWIRDMYITGNVFITDGVGDTDVIIENTQIDGTVFVRGSGSRGIHFNAGTRVETVVICNPNNPVRIDIDDEAYVGHIYVNDAVTSVNITGTVGSLYINTNSAPVVLTDSQCGTVFMCKRLSAFTTDRTTTIGSISVLAEAKASVLQLNGAVGELSIAAPDSAVAIYGKVNTVSVTDTAEQLDLTLRENATLSSIKAAIDDVNLKLSGSIIEVNLRGDNNTVSFAQGSRVGSVRIDGRNTAVMFASQCDASLVELKGYRAKLVVSSGCDLTDIKITADDAELSLGGDCEAKSVFISGKDLVVETASGCYIPEMYIAGENARIKLTGIFGDITSEADRTCGSIDGEIDSVYISGDNCRVNFSGEIFNVAVRGSNCKFGGNGVNMMTVQGGHNITISVGGATLLNNGGYTVFVGEDFVPIGEMVEIDSSGGSLVQEEEPPKEDDAEQGDDEEIKQSSAFELLVAASATALDIGPGNPYTYSSFTSGVTFDQTSGKLTGSINYLENFVWYAGGEYATGYYIPMYIKSVPLEEGAYLRIGDVVFGEELRSRGTSYEGKWMVPVYIDPANETCRISVTYDADGVGTKYMASTVVIDYSAISYNGGFANEAVYKRAKAMPGVDGAETAVIAHSASEDMTVNTYKISTASLLETRSANGRYGYWVGVDIPMPRGAASAIVTITPPVGLPYSNEVRNCDTLTIMVDASLRTESCKEFIADVVWLTPEHEVFAMVGNTVVLDCSGVKLAGEGEEEEQETSPIVNNLRVEAMTGEQCAELYGMALESFALGYGISDNTIVGVFLQNSDTTEQAYYRIPVKICGVATEKTTLLFEGKIITTIEEAGEFEYCVLLPGDRYGESLADFRISAVPSTLTTACSSVEITVDCSSTTVKKIAIVVSGAIPDSKVEGYSSDKFIKDAEYSLFYNMLSIYGEVQKQSSWVLNSIEYKDVWLVPVTIYVHAPTLNWVLEVIGYDGKCYGAYDFEDTADGKLTILVPLALRGMKFDVTTLRLSDVSDTGEKTEYFTSTILNCAELKYFE